MLKTFCKICVFSCVIWLITFSNASAQVVGGGNIEKPVAAQIGGLVNSNVFKRLQSSPVKSKTKTTPAKSSPVSKQIKSSKTPSKTPGKTTPPVATANYSAISFNPVANAGIEQELASAISNKRDEQAALIEIFKLTKTAYESEAAQKGKRNDVAMATTFFIATCLTVYHDSPEPSEAAIDSVYNTLAEAMIEDAAITKSSNIDKQVIHDRLVYLSGLVLVGYTTGKQNKDAATVQIFRLLAGACLKTLMQLDPDKLSFNKTGLDVKS